MDKSILQYLAQQKATPPGVTQPAPVKSSPVNEKSSDAGGAMWPLLMFVAVFVGMYFLVIRPQKKEEKRKKEMLGSLNKGDAVVTTSGILGTVASVKDETVIVNVGDGTRMEFLRSAIGELRNKKAPAKGSPPAKK